MKRHIDPKKLVIVAAGDFGDEAKIWGGPVI
jgi:hypothetical protein